MKFFHRIARYPEVWVLTVLALVTRLWQIGWPPVVVFDEVYFRQFAANYLSGHYFFDVHPPFVKLLFAGVAALFHFSPYEVAAGEPAGTVLRILPALAGAFLVPLVYVILRQLGAGRRIATLAGLFVLLDNALLVESRFVLMDSLLLLEGFGALSAYLVLRTKTAKKQQKQRWIWVVITAILMGFVVSTKWTGLAIAGLIAIGWFTEEMLRKKRKWKRTAIEGVATLAIIIGIYMSAFVVHFALLNSSGDGDAFMSDKFQSTLVGNKLYSPNAKLSFWDKFIELNKEMYSAQNSLDSVSHPYASKWYSWPFMARDVYYWQGNTDKNGLQGNIYLLGNPIIWWLSGLGALAGLLIWLVWPSLLGKSRRLMAFLLAGYGLNFVPFVFIDRPMFLYHYLFAFVFSIIITCILIGRFFDWQAEKYGQKAVNRTYYAIIAAVLLGFLYFLPLSYGWPMSAGDLMQKMWLPSWR